METGKGKAPMSIEAEQSLISTNEAKETFWTACKRCRMRYEYPKIFLNEKLLCIKCEEPFDALEMPPRNKPISKPQVKQSKNKQSERKGRRNEQEEWRKTLMEKGKKESKDLLNRLKGLSM